MSTAQLGMILGFISMGAIFAAALVAFLVTRASHPDWEHLQLTVPRGVFASSLLLLGVSGSIEYALRRIQRNDAGGLRSGLALTGLFAAAFLIGQSLNWAHVLHMNPGIEQHGLALFSFYLLTGLHAAHMLGGFAPLAVVYVRARQRDYSSSRLEGVKLCAQYWHFLSVMWVFVLAALLLV
jgi:cytochrome c oxidase subunit III